MREINLGFMSMRHAALPERAAAAAAAGFDGLALRADRWHEMQDSGWGAARVRELLADHRLRVSEIEPVRFLNEALLQSACEMVQAFQAPRVQLTPPLEPGPFDFAAVARWLAGAAARLPSARLAIEFLPPTPVPDAAAARALIDAAGAPLNLGFCVDSWHVFRGGGLASLRGIDARRVFTLQINDGPMQPTIADYIADCLRFRQPCGEGEFDLDGFLRALPPTAPINVEVISERLDQRAPSEVARLLYDSTRAALARAG
jgi:sugar phosphate isomerase/epimerase